MALMSDWWKEIVTGVAVITLASGVAYRVRADEEKIEQHDVLLKKDTEILEKLEQIAVQEDAAKKAKLAQCRQLIEAGKLKLGDCEQ